MSKPSPCVLIGWDGATFDLLKPWVEQGLLPNLAKMMGTGTARNLRSIIPPISPAAWASIMTGMNPGKHGIMDFQEFDPSDYVPRRPKFINSTHMAGTTILDILGERGLRVCSLQIPTTYPTWPVNGLLLAGIPNPDDSVGYTYPPDRNFGPLRPSKMQRRMNHAELLENCTFHIRKLTDIFLQVVPENFDFYCIYYRESDDAHHHFWRLLDETMPGFDARDRQEMGNPILTIYKLLDAELGRIMAGMPDANFFLISDHGGTAMGRRALFLNTWLENEGYLRPSHSLRGEAQKMLHRILRGVKPLVPAHLVRKIKNERAQVARTIARISNSTDSIAWDKTRAFAIRLNFPTMAVQLNVKGREPSGVVQPGDEYERLRNELIEKLKLIRDPASGRTIVQEIYRREEVFSGPNMHRMPDIVMVLDTAVVGRTEPSASAWGDVPETQFREISGDHDLNGIFVAAGPDIQARGFLDQAHLLDVAPTLVASLAQPVPGNMDGRVLHDIFDEDFLRSSPPVYENARELVAKGGEDVYSAEEEAAVRERLESLGYLEG